MKTRLAVCLPLLAAIQLDAAPQTSWTRSTPQVIDAMRSGGLPAAASVVGHFMGVEEDDYDGVVRDLYYLGIQSNAVVLARITNASQSQLYANNKSIFTDMQLTVVEAYRGPFQAGSTLTLRMKGGKIQFDNGTSAELKSQRNLPLEVGDECLFFLVRQPSEIETYTPTLGSQGVFEFDAESRVRSRARATDEVFKQYNGLARSEFLLRVRSATGS